MGKNKGKSSQSGEWRTKNETRICNRKKRNYPTAIYFGIKKIENREIGIGNRARSKRKNIKQQGKYRKWNIRRKQF